MTQAQRKYIKQLQQKKYRKLYRQFTVEGWKSIQSFLDAGYRPQAVYAVNIPESISIDAKFFHQIDAKTLRQISALKNPKDALAVFDIPATADLPQTGLILALDGLQDPGNLGTIIRTADWFGFRKIVCSEDTVDCYNPKVVQASMGSLANVQIVYTDLPEYLQQTNLSVYGTFLEGENLFQIETPKEAIVVIGNEGNGISAEVSHVVNHRITLPHQPGTLAESLNAAVASALVMACFVE